MRIDLPRRHRAGIGAIGIVLTAGLVTVMLSYGQGYYDKGYELTAVFPRSTQGLYTDGGSDVKLRGLNIGTVRDIKLLDDGRARITLFLDEGVRVPDTAAASIEPLSIFGPKFIRIQPGANETSGPFIEPGGEIARTTAAVEFTEILGNATTLLDSIDPDELFTIFDAVAEGVSGLGSDIGQGIDSSAELIDVAARHRADTEQFLADVAGLTDVYAENADELLATMDNLDELLPLAIERADDIDELLDLTTSISRTFAGLVDEHRADFATTVAALSAFIDGIYAERAQVPDFIDLIGTFFGRLADVMRIDGPLDKKVTALRGFFALDACVLLSICLGGEGG